MSHELENEGDARGLWFSASRKAELRTEELHPPQPREIQVRGIYSLVSTGSEMNFYRGEGNPPDLLVSTARGQLPFPIKFGYQVVGEVEAAGADSGYSVGEKLFAVHPHQDRFTIDAALVRRLPPESDLLRATLTGMCRVALHTFLNCPARPGDVVVVSGQGTIGQLTAKLARSTAGKVILIEPEAFRREKAAWIGADAIVAPQDAQAAIMELSGGRGADLFVETSGAPAALQTALRTTGDLGTIAVSAWYGTRPASLVLSPEFHLKQHRIVSVQTRILGGDVAPRWTPDRVFSTCLEMLHAMDVVPLITHLVPFSNAPEAYRLLDQRAAECLAVVLDYGTGHSEAPEC